MTPPKGRGRSSQQGPVDYDWKLIRLQFSHPAVPSGRFRKHLFKITRNGDLEPTLAMVSYKWLCEPLPIESLSLQPAGEVVVPPRRSTRKRTSTLSPPPSLSHQEEETADHHGVVVGGGLVSAAEEEALYGGVGEMWPPPQANDKEAEEDGGPPVLEGAEGQVVREEDAAAAAHQLFPEDDMGAVFEEDVAVADTEGASIMGEEDRPRMKFRFVALT